MAKKILIIVALVLAVIILSLLVYFRIPFSPTKKEYEKYVKKHSAQADAGQLMTADDFASYPTAIRKYVENCGYLGRPKWKQMEIKFRDSTLYQQETSPKMNIEYRQTNFVESINRFALIETSVKGIPFHGLDYFSDGHAGMKGVIGKAITIFDVQGEKMDQAALVTYLSECLLVPSALLYNDIEMEEISEYEVRATITRGEIKVSGIFTFNEEYEPVSFKTDQRAMTQEDNSLVYVPWTAVIGEYRVGASGLKQPTVFKAIWNFEDHDFTYFEGNLQEINYR